MCVLLVYFLTLRMSIFEKIMLDDILVTLQTKHHVIKAEIVQVETVQSGMVGNYPRSKLPFRGIIIVEVGFFCGYWSVYSNKCKISYLKT